MQPGRRWKYWGIWNRTKGVSTFESHHLPCGVPAHTPPERHPVSTHQDVHPPEAVQRDYDLQANNGTPWYDTRRMWTTRLRRGAGLQRRGGETESRTRGTVPGSLPRHRRRSPSQHKPRIDHTVRFVPASDPLAVRRSDSVPKMHLPLRAHGIFSVVRSGRNSSTPRRVQCTPH